MDFDYREAEDVVFLRTGSEKHWETALIFRPIHRTK